MELWKLSTGLLSMAISSPLHSFRLFLFYLIQKNVLFKDFDSFAKTQTDSLCSHIESYIRKNRLEEAEEEYLLQKKKVEREMEEFLQKYRMGEIYEKLDPHEKLKHLVAEFSFDEKEQPGLSFGVTGEEGILILQHGF